MNTLTGLKKLLAKLGGDPTKVDNNGDAIDAIAEAYADHEGDKLPVVTTADNGRKLSVVEGSWTKEKVINLVGTFSQNEYELVPYSITLPTGFTRSKLEKYLIDGYKLTLTMKTHDYDVIHFSMDSYILPRENEYGATLDSQGIWFSACVFHKGNANPPTIADPYVCTRYFVFVSLKDRTGTSDTLFYTNCPFPQ